MAKKKKQNEKLGPKPIEIHKAFLFINRSSEPTNIRQDKGYGLEGLIDASVSYVFVVFKGKNEKQYNVSLKVYPVDLPEAAPITLDRTILLENLAELFAFTALPKELFINGHKDLFYLHGDYDNQKILEISEAWTKNVNL